MTEPDDCDCLLTPAQPPPTPGLRDRLREATTRRLRRGRRLRRFGFAGSLAACYTLGGLTLWLARPTPRPETIVVEKSVPSPETRPNVILSPHALELAAEQADGSESARLFFEAGRRYGRDFNDWSSALRCYRNALDLAPELPATDPDDDWLLVKLKTERRDTHANP